MSEFLLTEAEKARFLQWLNAQRNSSKEMVRALEAGGMPEALVKKEKIELLAYEVLIAKLEFSEQFEVRGGGARGEG